MSPTSRTLTSLTSLAAALVVLGALVAPGDAAPAPDPASPSSAGTTAAAAPAYPRGARPRIPYRRAADVDPRTGRGTWQLRRPGGVTQALPRRAWEEFTVHGRTVVAGRTKPGAGARIEVVRPGRGTAFRRAASTRLVLSPDHSVAGWLRRDGRLATLGRAGAPVALPGVPRAVAPGALLGRETCSEADSPSGGCLAYVNQRAPRGVTSTSSHGIIERTRGLRSVSDVAPDGRVAGVLADDPRCQGVVDAQGRERWRTCFGHRLTGFSPSGRLTLALLRERGRVVDVMVHAPGGRATTIYDFASSPGFAITQLVWETDRSLLAVARSADAWRVLRLPVGKTRPTIEAAAGPLRTGRGEPPYQLPVR